MFAEVFLFECRYQLRHNLFWTVAATFFLLAFLAMASENLSIGGVGNNLNLNASYALLLSHYVFSILVMFAGVAFVAAPITRDYETKTMEMFVSTGVPRLSHLFGRFAGGFLFAFLVGCLCVLGTLIATFMPWLDPERLGPTNWASYGFSIVYIMLPNIFITSCIFFSVAALTRSIMASYVAIFALLVANVVVSVNTNPETVTTTALLDPFGMIPFGEITRYWTVFDKNTLVPEIQGSLAINRVIWMSVSFLLLGLSAWRYSFSISAKGAGKLFGNGKVSSAVVPPASGRLKIVPVFDTRLYFRQFGVQVMSEVRGVVKSFPFYVLLLFGIMNVLGGFYGALSQMYGTPVIPVTRMMLNVVEGSFLFIIMIIVVYYSGELVQRERQNKVSEIMDATPYPNAMMILAKVAGLWFVISMLLLIFMFTAIALQTINGYTHFEIGVYLFGLFVSLGWELFLISVVAIFIQILVDNKFLGMLLTILFFIVLITLDSYGFEHNLYSFGVPRAINSDMNGWGHYLPRLFSVGTYWSLFAVLLVIGSHLLMRRGEAENFRARLAQASLRMNKTVVAGLLVTLVAMSGIGVWIFYNSNILNEYITEDEQEAFQADYEKRFKQYENMDFPEVVDLDVNVDIYPEERRLESRGRFTMKNQSDSSLDRLHFSLNRELEVNTLMVPDSVLLEQSRKYGYYRFQLNTPLQPGETMSVAYDLTMANPGFRNSGSNTQVLHNGTFVNNSQIMPTPGYDKGYELADNNTRREYELDPVQRAAKLGDARAFSKSQMLVGSRVKYRTTVSTSIDQIAISPGYLQREWIDGDRRYFEYEMDAEIWPFVSFLSARYDVRRDTWRDEVDIEVYYHPGHEYNVARMIYASQRGLDYFTEEFSPYQYRQFRILEFPAYASFAQSFPNTIPYSEAIGFIADLSDDKNIDYVFYVTAHELAHQWWAHQVIGANMQGATVIVETLAQYSALMVMEREYGAEKMRRFLKYELDSYLRNRGGEQIEELPLNLVEGQGYIHYRKGSLVMYALKDAIGEDAVNRALRSFIAKYAFKGAPFPSSTDLIKEFRAVAGADYQQMITDLFERITIFDLRVSEAGAEQMENGSWKVSMDLSAAQYEADGQGQETEVDMAMELDIAIFPEAGKDLGDFDLPEPIYIERRIIVGGDLHLEFEVSEKPVKVGIDPYNKMVDKNPNDNIKLVSL